MKRKRKKIVIILTSIILVLLLLIASMPMIIYTSFEKSEESKGITFYLAEGDSYDSGWSYELSDDSILAEVDFAVYDDFQNRYLYWEFLPIAGAGGEVTIYFTSYQKTMIAEEECFSVTYYVDANYGITEISSENKPEKINYDADIKGLIKLKTEDKIRTFLVNVFAIIVDILGL